MVLMGGGGDSRVTEKKEKRQCNFAQESDISSFTQVPGHCGLLLQILLIHTLTYVWELLGARDKEGLSAFLKLTKWKLMTEEIMWFLYVWI